MRLIHSFLVAATLFFTSLPFAPSGYASNHTPESRQLGPLEVIIIENSKEAPYVVYLHGYGGTGEDAYNELKEELKTSRILKQVNWIFPTAPRGGWFNIEAIDDDTTEPLYDVWQATLKPTRQNLEKMLKSGKLNPKNVIWAGFSQGAITAIDYVLHTTVSPRGLIVNSGIYFDSTDYDKNSKHLNEVPFFMNHDPNDSMLPYEQAKKAEGILVDMGMKGELTDTRDAHTMQTSIIKKAILEILRHQP